MPKKERFCNECGGELIAPNGGFIICQKCGLAHDIILDGRPPLKEDDSGSEIGKSFFHDTPSVVSIFSPYIPRKLLSSKIGQIIKRTETATRQIRKNKQIFVELKKICNKYSAITHLYNHCCHFYRKIGKDLEFRGRGLTNEIMVWLVVYTQCRIYNIPFSLNFFKGLGFSSNDIKNIRRKFFFLKDKYKLPIFNPKINKSLWYLLNKYIKDYRLKSLLQKNILKLVSEKYPHFNISEKKTLITSMVYILLKRFKYCKITYKDLSKLTGISVDAIYRYTKKLKTL